MNSEINDQPLLISFDQQQFDKDVSSIDSLVTACNKAVTDFNNLEFDPVTESELPQLFTDPAVLLESKMSARITDEDLTLKTGLRISRESMVQNLDKPLGFILVADTIEKTRSIIIARHMRGETLPAKTEKEFWRYFTFTDGTLSIKESVIDRLKLRYQVYVKGSKAKALFLLGQSLRELLNESKIYETYFSKEIERYRGENLLSSLIKIKDARPTINIDHLVHVDHNG